MPAIAKEGAAPFVPEIECCLFFEMLCKGAMVAISIETPHRRFLES